MQLNQFEESYLFLAEPEGKKWKNVAKVFIFYEKNKTLSRIRCAMTLKLKENQASTLLVLLVNIYNTETCLD